MDNWTDHNTSITRFISPDEIPSIIDWILEDKNWNSYVGVSFPKGRPNEDRQRPRISIFATASNHPGGIRLLQLQAKDI